MARIKLGGLSSLSLVSCGVKGKQFDDNGQIRLSVRQVALKIIMSRDTSARAFRDLQAKYFFLRVVTGASLGVSGMNNTAEYEITTITAPSNPL